MRQIRSGDLSDMRTSSKFCLDLVKISMLQYNILDSSKIHLGRVLKQCYLHNNMGAE